MMKNLREAHHF